MTLRKALLTPLWFFLFFLISPQVFSQAPDVFNYQAVLRDAQGELLRSERVHLKVSILGGENGETLDYMETHVVRTSDHGQVGLRIGEGAPSKGVFGDMDWSKGDKWIKIDIDKNNDGDYLTLGQSRLLSVPYALYAKQAGSTEGDASRVDPDDWTLGGNSPSSHTVSVLGTNNAKNLSLITNDTERMFIKGSNGKIGIGICWDQWFPEAARIMTLKGAELLFYPTAIGSEPDNSDYDSRDSWQLVMQGHSAANCVPVIASNRIGKEQNTRFNMTFYGSSFISDGTGVKVKECSRDQEEYIVHEFDLDEIKEYRSSWGFFRDRRTDLYDDILKD